MRCHRQSLPPGRGQAGCFTRAVYGCELLQSMVTLGIDIDVGAVLGMELSVTLSIFCEVSTRWMGR